MPAGVDSRNSLTMLYLMFLVLLSLAQPGPALLRLPRQAQLYLVIAMSYIQYAHSTHNITGDHKFQYHLPDNSGVLKEDPRMLSTRVRRPAARS